MAGEKQIVGGDFLLEEEISFALTDGEFREKLFGKVFPVPELSEHRAG